MNGTFDSESGSLHFPDINTITADPILLHTTVGELADRLLATVQGKLSGSAMVPYSRTLNAFKEAIFNGRLTTKEIQVYARELTLLEEETPFLLAVWPYLYPLLLIAEKRP
jgi:hypothetical protein